MSEKPFHIACFSLSHTGCVRQLNEDRCYSNPQSGLWVVADGMGGHDAGDFASETIVRGLEGIDEGISAQDLNSEVRDRIFRSNGVIRRYSEERGNTIIGSTFVGLLAYNDAYRCLWAGDSRAYLLRADLLTQITRDHTEVQELLDRGMLTPVEAENYPRKNVITHAIGVSDYVYLDIADGSIQSGDTFLLCSDGLTAHVSSQEIGLIMSGRRPQEICDMLVALALERGGTDNVTVIVIQFRTSKATVPISRSFDVTIPERH